VSREVHDDIKTPTIVWLSLEPMLITLNMIPIRSPKVEGGIGIIVLLEGGTCMMFVLRLLRRPNSAVKTGVFGKGRLIMTWIEKLAN
jgi:hypothetical protein